MIVLQRDLHQQLREQSSAARERLAGLVRPLDPSQLAQRLEPTGWSIGEVLEHLCVSDEVYDAPTAALLRSARPDASAPLRPWRPSLLGGMLIRMLEAPKPIKAPKVFRPGPTPRPGAVEALIARELAFVAQLNSAASLDWVRLRLRSPALPWFMPRFNLGDVFKVHVVHVIRHTRQVERLIGRL